MRYIAVSILYNTSIIHLKLQQQQGFMGRKKVQPVCVLYQWVLHTHSEWMDAFSSCMTQHSSAVGIWVSHWISRVVWIRGMCARVFEKQLEHERMSVCKRVKGRSISFIWQRDQIWRHVPEWFSASLLPLLPSCSLTHCSIREKPLGSRKQKVETGVLTPK